MKDKILYTLKVIHLLILTGLLHSCCEEDYLITTAGEMNAWETTEDNSRNYIDTIRREFTLEVHFIEELVLNDQNFNLFPAAMALTCSENVLNPLDEESMKLSLNKMLIYNGDTLDENYNLLEIDTAEIKLSYMYGWIDMKFTHSFFDKIEIDNGDCTFKFNAMTSDEVELKVDNVLYIEL